MARSHREIISFQFIFPFPLFSLVVTTVALAIAVVGLVFNSEFVLPCWHFHTTHISQPRHYFPKLLIFVSMIVDDCVVVSNYMNFESGPLLD